MDIMDIVGSIVPHLGAIIIAGWLLSMAVKIIPEYERAVLFRLGRLVSVKGPGLILIIPFIDKIERVSLRIVVDDVPPQEVITKDNVTCRVNAVLYYRVTEPDKAILNVEHYHNATSQFAQTTMRSVVGQADLDELLSERDRLNKRIQEIVDLATDPWGIKVTAVEIRDVTIPAEMQRAIARQAEAERSRRAVVIQADGEKQAAQRIAEATEMLNSVDGAMTLRMLRTISESSAQEGNTVIFPLPMELRNLFTGDNLRSIKQAKDLFGAAESEKNESEKAVDSEKDAGSEEMDTE